MSEKRPKLEITDARAYDFILQGTPLVSKATSWNLELPTLNCRGLPKDQGYEEILLGFLRHSGIHGWEDLIPGLLVRLLEHLTEENALAPYQPAQETSWSFVRMWMTAT
jgi:hypothetical protein